MATTHVSAQFPCDKMWTCTHKHTQKKTHNRSLRGSKILKKKKKKNSQKNKKERRKIGSIDWNQRRSNFFHDDNLVFSLCGKRMWLIWCVSASSLCHFFPPSMNICSINFHFCWKNKNKKTATFNSQIAATPMTKICLKSTKYANCPNKESSKWLQPEICMTYLYTDV